MKVPTRLNPSAILDPIITTMSRYYEEPVTKPPINPDPNSNGKPSDHLIVLMKPICATFSVPPRSYRTIKTQPITESGMETFRQWMEDYRWMEMYTCSNVHRKAEIFQEVLLKNFHRCFPVKMTKLSSDDKPWITNNLKRLDRLRKREFF